MRRGRILILLGIILALGTAAIVFILLQGTAGGGGGAAPVEREEVVVAVQPIPENEPVEDRLDLRPMPKEAIPEGALRSLESTAGMLAAGPIPQGTIIQPDLLISPVEMMREGELGQLVEPGFVAVGFPINELSSVSYGIKPGDHVDVLVTLPFVDVDQTTQMVEPICPPLCTGAEGQVEANLQDQKPRLVTQLTLQNAAVLGVGRWDYAPAPPAEGEAKGGNQPAPETEPPRYITLMLTPQDALVLKLAREYGASIDLAVRAQDDGQVFTTQQVTLDYILARFGIVVPPKQPYALGSDLATPEQGPVQ
ncbi:MAG TPA: Flp pilus assembly protein CpaB [Anaerolineae bacterium]|nr:Flp pilus assembly protein CpaB [Anaerolineae bacterium]